MAIVEVMVDIVEAATVLVAAGSGYLDEQYDSAGPKPERSEATIWKIPVHGVAAETKREAKMKQLQITERSDAIVNQNECRIL